MKDQFNTKDVCKMHNVYNSSNYDFLILVAEFRIFAGLRIFFISLETGILLGSKNHKIFYLVFIVHECKNLSVKNT